MLTVTSSIYGGYFTKDAAFAPNYRHVIPNIHRNLAGEGELDEFLKDFFP
jgi:hypothetical protein